MKLWMTITLLALAWAAQAQLTGRVLDENELPLVGANVTLGADRAFGTATDGQGRFVIKRIAETAVELHVTMIGYAGLDTLLRIQQGGEVVLRMHASPVALGAAEVTALRASDRSPFAQSTVTRERIERINTGVDLPYVLDQQPSVVATSDGGTGVGYTYMRIRGTDGTRTNITVNGVPFNDPESQGAFLVNMPDLVTSAEDIEVQRGVGTSTNGPAAFGASVNVRTTAIKRDPWGQAGASGGSYGTQRYAVSAGTGLIDGRFSLDARLSSISTDGYIDRASADLKSYFLQGAWVGAKRSVRFIHFRGKEHTYQAWAGVSAEVIDTNRTYNPYTYDNEVDDYDQAHYQLLFDQRISSNATLNLTLFRVDGAGYFEQYRADDDLGTYGITPAVINNDTVRSSDLIRRRWLDNTLLGANVSTDIRLGRHRLVVGGSYSDYRGAHFGELIWARYAGPTSIRQRYYDDDAHKTDANAYAKLTYAVNDRVDVFGDMQMRTVSYALQMLDASFYPAEQTVSYAFLNPKAGLLWRVHDGGKAYASVAVGNREPNRDDLEETTPQSRPRSEHLIDYEAGYERRGGRWSGGVNAYYMDYKDQLVLTGELNDVGAALRTNAPRSYRAGIELMGALQLGSLFTWRANATLSRNRVLEFTEYVDDWDNGGQVAFAYGESDLSFSPWLIAGSEITWHAWKRDGKGRADLTWVAKYVGEQYLDNSGSPDRRLDAFFVNDLRANVTLLAKGTKGIDVNLTFRNVLSELYESNGWVYSYVYEGVRQQMVGLFPQAPANVMGGITVRF